MKITTKDYQALEAAIKPVLAQYPQAQEQYKAQGLSDMRFNWDVVRKSGFDVCSLYHYLNDEHINTALKSIIGNTGKSSKQVAA